jgi:hypothetical protein
VNTTINRGGATGTVISSGALLDTWATLSWDNGVRVDRLTALDRLIVTTRHSRYELVVLTPGSADVMVRGGAFFPEFTRARVSGSSLGGSFLKLHTIHSGFRMELSDGTRNIITSPVQDVVVTNDAGDHRIM